MTNRFRVKVFLHRDSAEVDTIVETKQSARTVINRFLRKYPDCYEVTADSATGENYSSFQEPQP